MKLVGRAAELGVLMRALDEACAGRGGSVLLLGEPGIGKTRLADELSLVAQARGARVAWGRAWDGGGAPAHWILREAFAALGAVSADAPLMAALDAAPALDAHAARFSLAQRALEALSASSASTLLVLDDIHAADTSSLRVLECMLRGLRARPVLVVMTARDAESQGEPALRDAVAALAREARVLSVARLDKDAVAALAHEGAAPAVAHDVRVIDDLVRVTEGNPLFVTEMLVDLSRDPSALRPGRTAPIPLGVREAVRRRLDALDAEARATLDALAVVGRPQESAAFVARVMARAEDDVRAALERARDRGVLVERAPGQFSFFHGLVRDALVRDLPRSRREALHAQIADALAAQPHESAHGEIAMATHLLEAGDRARADGVRAALAAARRADAELAFDEAVALLSRALDALQGADAPLQLLIDTKTALGTALLRVGERERGRALCHEAIELARAIDDPERLAHAALATGSEFDFGFVRVADVAALRAALARLPNGPTHARVRARLAAAAQPAKDPFALVDEAEAAIAEAEQCAEPLVELETLHAAMAAMADYAHPKRRAALNERALALAEEHDDVLKELRAHARLVLDYVEGADVDRAVQHCALFSERAQAVGRARELWQAQLLHALIASLRGRFDDAARAGDAARAIVAASDDVGGRACLVAFDFALARQAQRTPALERAIESFGDIVGHPDGPFLLALFRADVHARVGRRDEARALFEQAMGPLAPTHPDTMIAYFAADLALRLDARAVAPSLARWLPAEQHDRVFSWGMVGCVAEGPVRLAVGHCAWLAGDVAGALAAYQRAHAEARALGARPAEARALLGLARASRAAGPTHDDAAAQEQLVRARALADACGMPELAAEIDSVAAHVPVGRTSPAPSASVSFMPVVFAREGDVWRVSRGEESTRVKDSRGMTLLAALVERAGEELSSLELASPTAEPIDGGDAGELLDERARRAYRAHVAQIEERLDEAERHQDLARAARLRAERDAVARELSRAVGLGGRARKAGLAAERARSAVQRRIKDALDRIEAASPGLGAHLRASVRTGATCVYRPTLTG